jgi:hypothetical protein
MAKTVDIQSFINERPVNARSRRALDGSGGASFCGGLLHERRADRS